jgi:hypothetical protein
MRRNDCGVSWGRHGMAVYDNVEHVQHEVFTCTLEVFLNQRAGPLFQSGYPLYPLSANGDWRLTTAASVSKQTNKCAGYQICFFWVGGAWGYSFQ